MRPKTREKNGCLPFRVQISASFSRGEVSCRRGGSAGREEPELSRMMHPVCFSQSAPTQSPPQYVTITHHTYWVISRLCEGRFSNMQVCVVEGLWRLFSHNVTPQNRQDDVDYIFPLACDIQCCLLYKKSSSSAWCRDTRSPWVEIRQKGILCYR